MSRVIQSCFPAFFPLTRTTRTVRLLSTKPRQKSKLFNHLVAEVYSRHGRRKKMGGAPVRLLVGMFVFSMTCSNLWGQATAQISGTVKDQSGAVLPGVE